jgi:hypothetical protein
VTTTGPGTPSASPVGLKAPRPSRRKAALGFVGGVVAFLPLVIVAQLVDLVMTTEEDSHEARSLITWSIVSLGPAALFWWRRGVWRWVSAGIAAAFVCTLAGVLVFPLFSNHTHRAEHRLRTIATNSHISIYYLGPTFDGWELDDAGIDDHGYYDSDYTLDAGDKGSLLYGSTCSDGESGDCGWQFEVRFHRITRADAIVSCRRQLPVTRGVPTIQTTAGELVAFTDQVAVSVAGDQFDALGKSVVLGLRPIGKSAPTASDLPPPPQFMSRAIAKGCPKP